MEWEGSDGHFRFVLVEVICFVLFVCANWFVVMPVVRGR